MNRRDFLKTTVGVAAGAGALSLVDWRPALAQPQSQIGNRILLQQGLGGSIMAFDPVSGAMTELAAGGVEPSWSRARNGFVYAVWNDTPTGVFLQTLDGAQPVLLVEGKEYLQPKLSPDGNQLAYLRREEEKNQIGSRIIVNANTGINVIGILGNRGVAPPGGTKDNWGLSWSPDGQWFGWSSEDGIFIADVTQGAEERPDGQNVKVRGSDRRWQNPQWSPAGDQLVFLYLQHDHWEVAVTSPWSGGLRLLTRSAWLEPVYEKRSPVWSPDGSQIAYLSTQDGSGQFKLWVMNADGTRQRKLSDMPFAIDYTFTRLLSWA